MKLFGKKYREKELAKYYDKCLYFSQYLGHYFGSRPNGQFSRRQVWSVSGSAVYHYHPGGDWVHISNAFLWLKTIDHLTDKELRSLDKVIFPKRRRASVFIMKARCAAVIYKTDEYEFFDERLYTIDVHLKMISLGMATTWFDGGKTRGRIGIEDLIKRGWIAGPHENTLYRDFHENPGKYLNYN